MRWEPSVQVYGVEDPQLLKRLFRGVSGGFGCRYAVAWPSVALEELDEPLLVLDGLTSAMNLGQSLRCSFHGRKADWEILLQIPSNLGCTDIVSWETGTFLNLEILVFWKKQAG